MEYFTTKQVAGMFGTRTWKVRRLYENGDLPEPSRLGNARAIAGGDLPQIVDALRSRGWLPEPKAEVTA